jgi:hypothetical protein
MFAPSAAAFSAIAFPMPRDAPVMNKVLPANFLQKKSQMKIFYHREHLHLSEFLFVDLIQRHSKVQWANIWAEREAKSKE